MLSLFSGIGGFEEGLDRNDIDYELVGYSEVDDGYGRAVQEVYEELHDAKGKYLGLVQDVSGSELGRVDLITHGSPCFKKGTLITTSQGLRKIEDIKKGDMVLTHENRFKEVLHTMVKHSNEIYEVRIQGSPITHVTEEHPYYVREMTRVWNNETRSNERVFSDPKWKTVSELRKGDFIGFGLNTNEQNSESLTEDECWLIGRYIADGYIRNSKRPNRENSYNNQIIICIGKDKLDDFRDIKDYYVGISEDRTVYKARIINKRLMDLCMECGRGSANKVIPQYILDLPKGLLKVFLDGYMSGDGCFTNNAYQATSVSKKLIYQLGQVANKVYEVPYSISYCKRPKTTVIEGRTVNQRDTWAIRFSKAIKKQNQAVVIDKVAWHPFREKQIIDNYNDNVFNFEVEDDNSYVANNCIVHNCQNFSIAGGREGGDKGSDTQSSLMWETVRIIEESLPKYVIWENVKSVLFKSNIHNFEKYLNKLEDLGYTNYHEVLVASDFGLPQKRERVFVVSVRGEGNFKFPVSTDKSSVLRDILECEVDDKYTVPVSMIEGWYNKKPPFGDRFNLLKYDDVGYTLVAKGGRAVITNNYILKNEEDYRKIEKHNGKPCLRELLDKKIDLRALTPREYWRMQGWSEQSIDRVIELGVSDARIYTMAGNSIPVNVLEEIFKNLLKQ